MTKKIAMLEDTKNKDGTLYNMGRNRKTMNYVNDIVSTMDSKDKKLLNLTGEEY